MLESCENVSFTSWHLNQMVIWANYVIKTNSKLFIMQISFSKTMDATQRERMKLRNKMKQQLRVRRNDFVTIKASTEKHLDKTICNIVSRCSRALFCKRNERECATDQCVSLFFCSGFSFAIHRHKHTSASSLICILSIAMCVGCAIFFPTLQLNLL